MTSPREDFLSGIRGVINKEELEKSLKKYYNSGDGAQVGLYDNLPCIPMILSKTHVTTVVDQVTKSISISDFKNIINSLTSSEDQVVPPICLPFGCFMFNRSGDMLFLNCYYKECIMDIKYDGRGSSKMEKFKIPFPNIIISFTLKSAGEGSWQLITAKFFSTSKSVTQLPGDKFINEVNTANGIFKLPVANMYGDNKMCYGGNTMPVRFTNNLRGLDYYYQILSIAPFNSDLGLNGVKNHSNSLSWFKFLHNKKEYPYDELINN